MYLWKSNFYHKKHFVQKLINRNEFVLQSDLPLKEELRKILGILPKQREQMVWSQYKVAKDKGLTLWEGDESFTPAKDSLYKEMVDWKRESFWGRKFDKIHKAVRDKIPEIIKYSGKNCNVKKLDDSEFLVELEKKLIEELSEYQKSKDIGNWQIF